MPACKSASTNPQRLLILGAHPDDAEYHAGGLAARYRRAGHVVRMVSVSDGSAGHHRYERARLAEIRRQEAAAAGAVIGAEYFTWDFRDGEVVADLNLRGRIIREIRQFKPDLVLTHRPNDYHPDHRAVGQAVQDACYLVTVPLVEPTAPILPCDPVVASMVDLFTKPVPLDPQVTLDVSDELETIVSMLACHRSQFFEWLPFNSRILHEVPTTEPERRDWLRHWYLDKVAPRRERFGEHLARSIGAQRAGRATVVEAYEISEYAGRMDERLRKRLFLL